MFSRQRLSRAPEQPINSGAIAAASAIGKALKKNGRTVDQSKLPQYNNVPDELKRASSVVGSRRNSLQPRASMSSSRNSSLTSTGSAYSNISDGGRRKAQVRAPNSNFNRSYSLQNQRKPPSRNNSVTSRTTEHGSDPQHAFHEFGGPQTSGILHKSSSTAENRKTIRKYLPSAHGLVAVEVPVEEHLLQQKRASSLRRSTSTNGLSISRNGSLTKRKSSDTSSNSQYRRHSSLTNTSHPQTSSSPDNYGRARRSADQPLIQTFLQEETEQELKQDDTVLRPLLISRDVDEEQAEKGEAEPPIERQRVEEADLLDKSVELQEKILEEEQKVIEETETIKEQAKRLQMEQEIVLNHITTNTSSEKEQKNKSDVDQDSRNEETKAEEPTTKADNVNPDHELNLKEHDMTPQVKIQEETDAVIFVSHGKDTEADLTKEVLAEINNLGTKEEISEDEFVDSQDGIDNFKENEIESGTDASPKRPIVNGPSLAQHLRAANPYLKQADTDSRVNEENEPSHRTSSLEVNKNGTKALYKVPSPMKSALKKTNTHSSNTSSIYSEKSPANQAYLSLTTAENTRLNAQLASTENLPLKPNAKHLSRPQSMVNPKGNRSNSPTPRESTRSKRVSTGSQPRPANKSTFYKTSNDSIPDAATAAAKTSATASRMKNNSANRIVQVKGSQKKDVSEDSVASKTPSNDILYPREPPQKKSSFEKLRNQDTHLGFKKLSLRDEYITDAAYEQSNLNNKFRQNLPATPNRQNSGGPSNGLNEAGQIFIQNSGWKSRFHDSDSEDENAPFSSAGTSRSTQPTTAGTANTDKSNGSGFSLFKHKGKSHNSSNLAPPQPQYLEKRVVEQKVEKNGTANVTPTKINKKWSKLSLRSSSTGESYDVKHQVTAKKNVSPEKRFHSNSKVEGFSYENMKPRTLRGDVVNNEKVEVDTSVKKKNAFGKKLKKLFGRNT